MTWRRHSDDDALPPPPAGWSRGVIQVGDTLALLEKQSGVPAHELARANGVPWPGRKTCAWAVDVAMMVIGTGGRRAPFVASEPNNCEPGQGFPMFVPGQVINLPEGLRPRPPASSPAAKQKKASKAPLVVLGALGAAAAGAAVLRRRRKAA